MLGRMEYTFKNAAYSLLSQIVGLFIAFLSKTVILRVLGKVYSGVGGLYGNILGILSLAEMGFGAAMAFALYKPVAEKNTEKIKSMLFLYKKTYRKIAVIVAVLGISLAPFLKYIINGGEVIGYKKLTAYYLLYLFDMVSSYFFSYKYSVLYAEQKGYIYTNISVVWNIISNTFKIAGLILLESYAAYLAIGILISFIQKLHMNMLLNKRYPYLKERYAEPLEKTDENEIRKNVKALIMHNIGGRMVNGTDNIIISAFINITVLGCVSFYTTVINALNSFVNTILGAAISSIGNIVATESREKQKDVIDKYVYVNSYLSGFTAVGVYVLISPFVEIIWGNELLISDTIVFFLVFSVYLSYQLNCINNIKSAAGIFEQDKFVPILQSVINLVVSVILAGKIGVAGVYIGTIVQAVAALLIKVNVTYKAMFGGGISEYLKRQLFHLFLTVISGIVCIGIKHFAFAEGVTVFRFAFAFIAVCVLTNAIFIFGLRNAKETKYFVDLLKEKHFIGKRLKK